MKTRTAGTHVPFTLSRRRVRGVTKIGPFKFARFDVAMC